MDRPRTRGRRFGVATGAMVIALSLFAAACGGGDSSGGGNNSGGGGSDESATPTSGGKVVYGLEAETSGGWCLPESQLAISGIQVARAIYDGLTTLNSEAEATPYLAESFTPNADFTQWTFKIRQGVTFHDGTPLDATVVKNNLDAFRGSYPGRNVLLFRFVFQPVVDVQAPDPQTVVVTTNTPWPAFPSLLASGRFGMMAQAQLDDAQTCDTNLIGTGPFKLQEWKVNDKFVAVKNPNYWQKDADGTQLPYLDEIEFRPIPDADTRVSALQSGELNAMHTSGADQIVTLRESRDSGEVNLVESDTFAEVSYGMLNTSKPPFDNLNARLAALHAVDRDAYNQVINQGIFTMATGPFGQGEVGYLEDSGFPEYDPEKAKEYIEKYKQETGATNLEFTLVSTPDPGTVRAAQFIAEYAEKVGAKVNLKQVEQAQLINTALGNDWQALSWRNHPGGNPDGQYNWWIGGSPVNFNKFNDPEINRLLNEGRAAADPETAAAAYEGINKRFAEQAYNLWLNWTQWDIASAPDVSGVYGPNNPDGSEPFEGLAAGHPVLGLFVSK